MRVFLAAVVLIAASLALIGQVHPFPGPGGAPNSTPTTGIVTSGLVAYWDLNTAGYNAATGKFTDFSGTGNHIFKGLDATTDYDPVVDANYADFTTQGMRCNMESDTASMSITGNITIEVILSPATNTAYRKVVHKGGSSEFELTLGSSSTANKTSLFRSNTASAYSTAALAVGTWYSVAVTATGTAVAQYLNAAANGTGTTGTASDGTGVVQLAQQGTAYYTGKIARVRIYNRALSPAEIASNYARDKIVLAGRGISLP